MRLARLLVLAVIVLASASALDQSPVIVAQLTLLNQNNQIPPTVLLTPATHGIYRVSAYMTELATKFTVGTYNLVLNWSDEAGGPEQSPPSWVELPANRYSSGTLIVRSVAGKSIQYYVNGSNGTKTNFSYNLFITVEQLETD